jgi:hypothetical protein
MMLGPVPDFENDESLTPIQKQRRRYYYASREKNIRKSREWEKLNPEKANAGHLKWRNENPEKHREAMRRGMARWRERNPDKVADLNRSDKKRLQANSANADLKRETMFAYGGSCVCCGEDSIEFLTLDHINNDGGRRRKLGEGGGSKLYRKLRKLGYPKGEFQVLCMNCNFSKGSFGYCPHEVYAKSVLGLAATINPVVRTRVVFIGKNLPPDMASRIGKKRSLSPAAQEEMLDMYRMGTIPVAEIATIFKVSEGTIYNTIHRVQSLAVKPWDGEFKNVPLFHGSGGEGGQA